MLKYIYCRWRCEVGQSLCKTGCRFFTPLNSYYRTWQVHDYIYPRHLNICPHKNLYTDGGGCWWIHGFFSIIKVFWNVVMVPQLVDTLKKNCWISHFKDLLCRICISCLKRLDKTMANRTLSEHSQDPSLSPQPNSWQRPSVDLLCIYLGISESQLIRHSFS